MTTPVNSSPGWQLGDTPTATAWNALWGAKIDAVGGQADSLTVTTQLTVNGTSFLNGNVGVTGNLNVTGSITGGGNISAATVTANGTGAVPRTLAAQASDVYNVLNFGPPTMNLGGVYADEYFQACITAAEAAIPFYQGFNLPASITVPAGSYLLQNPLRISANGLVINGEGSGCTTLVIGGNQTQTSIFTLSNPYGGVELRGMTLKSFAPHSSGTGIVYAIDDTVGNNSGVYDDLYISGFDGGIKTAGSQPYFLNLEIDTLKPAYGIGIDTNGGNQPVAANITILGSVGGSEPATACYACVNGGSAAIELANCELEGGQYNFVIVAPSNSFVLGPLATNVYFDNATVAGVLFDGTLNPVILGQFSNCWFGNTHSAATAGLWLRGMNYANTVTGCLWGNISLGDAIRLEDGAEISGLSISGGLVTSTAGRALYIGAGVSNVSVLGLMANPMGFFAAPNYGVYLAGGNSNIVIDGVNLLGCGNAAIAGEQTNNFTGICLPQTRASAGNLTLNGALISGGVATFAVATPITISSASNNSGITLTIIGTNSVGGAQTQTITGPNAGNVFSSDLFKTVTSISCSGAITGTVFCGAAELALNGALVSGGVATMSAAYPVQIISSGNDSGITYTVVGTTTGSVPQTATVTGTNAGTATPAGVWLTVTQVYSSGAIAGLGATVGIASSFKNANVTNNNCIFRGLGITTSIDPNNAQALSYTAGAVGGPIVEMFGGAAPGFTSSLTGLSSFSFYNGNGKLFELSDGGSASGANLGISSGASAYSPGLYVDGTATNIGMVITPKGSGSSANIVLGGGNPSVMYVATAANNVVGHQFQGNAAGGPAQYYNSGGSGLQLYTYPSQGNLSLLLGFAGASGTGIASLGAFADQSYVWNNTLGASFTLTVPLNCSHYDIANASALTGTITLPATASTADGTTIKFTCQSTVTVTFTAPSGSVGRNLPTTIPTTASVTLKLLKTGPATPTWIVC